MSPRFSVELGGNWVEILIGALIALIVVLLLARGLLTSVIVFEYQRGLKFVDGKFVGMVDPGRHWLWRPSQEVRVVDSRESLLPVPGQEVVTSDGVSVKLSLAVRFRIADPVVAYKENDGQERQAAEQSSRPAQDAPEARAPQA
jgi:regulator of protease activity HflC (stomatin/prohibitin superfamily)